MKTKNDIKKDFYVEKREKEIYCPMLINKDIYDGMRDHNIESVLDSITLRVERLNTKIKDYIKRKLENYADENEYAVEITEEELRKNEISYFSLDKFVEEFESILSYIQKEFKKLEGRSTIKLSPTNEEINALEYVKSHIIFPLFSNINRKLITKKITLDISKFNPKGLFSLIGCFVGCSNVNFIGIDKWDVSEILNISFMFNSCENLYFEKMNLLKFESVKDCYLIFDRLIGCNFDGFEKQIESKEILNAAKFIKPSLKTIKIDEFGRIIGFEYYENILTHNNTYLSLNKHNSRDTGSRSVVLQNSDCFISVTNIPEKISIITSEATSDIY